MGFGSFDFGLDEAAERRAAELHTTSVVVDMLFWGPLSDSRFDESMVAALEARERSCGREAAGQLVDEQLRSLALEHAEDYRQAWDETGVTAGSREVDLRVPIRDLARHVAEFDRFDWLHKALTASDIRRAKTTGGHAGFLNTQDVGNLTAETLRPFYDLGLRVVMPTYNGMNHLGSGCTERVDGGLSRQGVRLVETMNELGMLVDAAHCGEQTTLDICRVSSAPVIASHTAASATFAHARGKSDEELDAIADTGGVVGIVTLPDFIGPAPVTVEATLQHVEYAVSRIGADHVGIGTDWPMAYPKWWIRRLFAPDTWARDGWSASDFGSEDVSTTSVGFADPRDWPNLTRGLVARGLSDDDIRAIIGENFLRVFGSVCG